MGFYKSAVSGAKPENINKPLKFKDKIAYAAGDFGCNMSFALGGTYLMLFWTEFIGFSKNPDLELASKETLAIWTIIILLVKIWDAINDPLIGGLMDKMQPKPGQSKFKPWIFWGSIALMFGGALCFIPIRTAPIWVRILVCVAGYLIWDMAYTIVNVPYGSLNSVISTNSTERASLSTWRSIGSFVGNIVLVIGLPLIVYDTNGALIGEIMFTVGLITGIVGFICFQFLCRGTTERVIIDYEAQKRENKTNYFKSLANFFKNKAAVSYTLASIFQLLAMAFMQTYVVYFFKSAWPEYVKFSGLFSFLGMLPMLLFIPFATKLVKRFGKKEASAWPNVFGVLAGILLLAVPMENVNPALGITIFTISSVFIGLAISVNSLVGWAMVADCIDSQEIKTGVREEGVVYATYSLGRKLAQGIGSALVSSFLIFAAYNTEFGDAGLPQVDGVAFKIRMILGGVYLVCFILQFVLLQFVYDLDKNKVEEMEKELGRSNDRLVGEKIED